MENNYVIRYSADHGFSNCGTRTTPATPIIVSWYWS